MVISRSYWTSPLWTASSTAATTSRLTILDTRVTARFPSRLRRWIMPTADRVVSITAAKKQIRAALCRPDRGVRYLRRIAHHLTAGYAPRLFQYAGNFPGNPSVRQTAHQILKDPPPLLKVFEAVEGGTGRGEDHYVPHTGPLRRQRYGGGVILRL